MQATISMTLVFALLAWTISLSHAQARDYYQDLAICKGLTARTGSPYFCEGLIMCAIQQASADRDRQDITTGCMAELGWRMK